MSAPKPSILLLGTQMEVAGAQRVLLSQAEYLHQHGYPVQAVFLYDKQGLAAEWQASGPFPVTSLNGWKHGGFLLSNLLRLPGALLRLAGLLRRSEVVITHTPHSNLLGLPLAWLAGVRTRIGTHHSHPENTSRLLIWLHGRLTNSALCTRMVCVSSQVRSLAMRTEGAASEKLVVIDNGIHPPQLGLSSQQKDSLRAALGVQPGQLLLLTVGRLVLQKGHTYLLDAIKALDEPAAVFAFVGQGPLQAELEDKARQWGIAARVRFAGVRSDVPQLLEAADIFVQPSLWEGMSLALLEAMFAGLPIIATRIEAATDVLEDERTALLVELKDPEGMAEALRRLIGDAGLRARLGAAAQQEAQQNYTVDVMGAAYAKLIEDLLRRFAARK
ncbi:MAG: glycosyltransferase family 4 protein [Anaerolineales bacterium]|nr:MAG: glycosyltransferase family 4 protein [Anaerolineales bacterium]